MKRTLLTAALAGAITAGATLSPALADGAARARNVIVGGAAAAVLVTNYNHKVRIKRQEQQVQARRQASYRSWFYRHYGYYPSESQFRGWYYRTYSVYPS